MEGSISVSAFRIDEENLFRKSESLIDQKLNDGEVAELGRDVNGLIAVAVSVFDVGAVFDQQDDGLQVAGVRGDVKWSGQSCKIVNL